MKLFQFICKMPDSSPDPRLKYVCFPAIFIKKRKMFLKKRKIGAEGGAGGPVVSGVWGCLEVRVLSGSGVVRCVLVLPGVSVLFGVSVVSGVLVVLGRIIVVHNSLTLSCILIIAAPKMGQRFLGIDWFTADCESRVCPTPEKIPIPS